MPSTDPQKTAEPVSGRILLEIRNTIAVLTLNRPEARNALDDVMRVEMARLVERVAGDPAIRALVITGNGSAFCAGGDIKSMRERLKAPAGQIAANGWRRMRHIHHVITSLNEMEKPTIAAVNGAAAGLGCDLAFACDFVVASQAASFQMSYVLRGLIPDGGGLYFLPRRVGLVRAKELFFSARRVLADEAKEIGLAERIVAAETLVDDAVRWAEELSRGAATAIALTKAILDHSFESSLQQTFREGAQAQGICYSTDEHRDAVNSFVTKASK
jgi:enoyl-CoA hydratase/carnithine racemase